MTGFQFETGPSEGTNRAAPTTDCDRCQGDRFVEVDLPELTGGGGYTPAMLRCPLCNAPGGIDKQPVEADSWWKGDA